MSAYDLVIVGGGLGGSSLAKGMAERGARVLVVERETRFKDRVRGEQMHPWGVAETRGLGTYDLLRASCGHELPWWDSYAGPELITHRHLPGTTPQQAGEFAFYHPAIQEVLLQAAADAGAEVRRGAIVRNVRPGERPSVVLEGDGGVDEAQARLVVGADGRTSMPRQWRGFTARRDPERLLIAGLLFDEMPIAEDTSYTQFNAALGRRVLLFPQGAAESVPTSSIERAPGGAFRETPILPSSWRHRRPRPSFMPARAPPGRWPRLMEPIHGSIIPTETASR